MMSDSVLDDLGFNSTTPSASASSSQGNPQGDPAVWTVLGEAGHDTDGQVAVASTLYNRAKKSGKDISDVASDPDEGYEAWQNPGARQRIQQLYPVGSPQYNKAQTVLNRMKSGDIDPLPYTSFYSPVAQAKLGRDPPPFEDHKSGVDIGGNRFFTTGTSTPATSILDDLGFNTPAEASSSLSQTPGSSPNPIPTPAHKDTEPSTQDQSGWPVYDQYNNVGRNQDGTIAYVGKPPTQDTNGRTVTDSTTGLVLSDPGQVKSVRALDKQNLIDTSQPVGDVKNPYYEKSGQTVPEGQYYIPLGGSQSPVQALSGGYRSPGTDPIKEYLLEHPKDPANHLGTPYASGLRDTDDIETPGANDLAAEGVQHGLNNVRYSAESLMTNPFFNQSQLPGTTTEDYKATLARHVLENNQYKLGIGQSPFAQAGQFGGEVAATLPLMAAGDEAAGAVPLGRFGQFLGGASKGNPLIQGASLATRGAIQGTEAAGLTSSDTNAPLVNQLGQGALSGALTNVVPRGLVAAGAGAVNKFLPTVSPEVSDLADKAINKYGIKSLRTSQILGAEDPHMNLVDSELMRAPGSGYKQSTQIQPKEFAQAVAQHMLGLPPNVASDGITPATMTAARELNGNVMNDVASRTSVPSDPLLTKLGAIVTGATDLDDSQTGKLTRQISSIGDRIQNGVLSGTNAKAIIQRGTPLDNLTRNKDTSVAGYASQMRQAILDSIQSAATPEDATAFQKARLNYKNMITIKELAAKAGINGTISPTQLQGVVNRNFNDAAFSGAGPAGDLSKIGQVFMKEPPNSMTTARMLYNIGKFGVGGAGLGAVGEAAIHNPLLAAQLAGSGVALKAGQYGVNRVSGMLNNNASATNRLLGKTSPIGLSPVVQSFLDNRVTPMSGIVGRNLFNQN